MDFKISGNFSRVQSSSLSPRSRNLRVEAAFLLIAIVLSYIFLLRPKSAERSQKQAAYEVAASQKESIEKDVLALERLGADLKQSSNEISKLDEGLPLQFRQIRLQALLERLSRQSGVVVGSMSIDGGQGLVVAGNRSLLQDPYGPTRKVSAINVNMNLSGTIGQLQNFLQRLESYGRIMDITSLAMVSNQQNLLDLNLSMTTYYFGAVE